MTIAGWWIMSLSVGTVVGVFLVCIWLVFTTPHSEETLHGFESDLPDPDDLADAPPPTNGNNSATDPASSRKNDLKPDS
jgi:hypothetical protein